MRIGIAVAGALAFAAISGPGSAQADFGFLPGAQGFSSSIVKLDSSPETQAGSHPYQATISFGFNSHDDGNGALPDADPKDLQIELPEALNPRATPSCTELQLESDLVAGGGCPASTQVGIALLDLGVGLSGSPAPLYNMTPPGGSSAEFGFDMSGIGLYEHVFGALGGAPDYGFSAGIRDLGSVIPVIGGTMTLWGNPSDAAHDAQRGSCLTNGGSCPVERTDKPLLTLPTDCSAQMTTTIRADSWQQPGNFVDDSAPGDTPSGCPNLDFSPKIAVATDSHSSDSPSGLLFDIKLPQNDNAAGLAEANLKKSVVALPEGLMVNPSAAGRLGACSAAQVDLASSAPADCPDNSKIGSVEVETPLLDHLAKGSIYLADPGDNPFGALLAIYVAIHDPRSGIVVKFPAEVKADDRTGQITTVFDDVPRLPFSELKLDFFGGPRGTFKTPTTCGTYTATSALVPWSAADPDHPTPAETATPSSSFQITQGPNGSACADEPQDLPNAPTVSIGTETPLAGIFSPFTMRVSREDGSQEMRGLEINLPPGFAAKLAGIPYCSDAAIAAAASHSGAAELADPSCPASRIGHLDLFSGAGPNPIHIVAGMYLAGPYKGAPFSFEVITPSVAGPIDLGTVVNRTAIFIDPNTVSGHVVTDPFPQILDGIPVDARVVAPHLDRPGFFLNSTSCDPLTLGTTIHASDSTATLSSPFELGGCAGLGFSPKLSITLKGGTHRSAHPKLTADFTQPPEQANIAQTVVSLPPSEQIDQSHIKTICTRAQFAADTCPAGAIYGEATAESPLIDQPLAGPIYLVAGGNPLPDVVLALHGQISLNVRGTVDTVNRRLRTTFTNIPDAPASHVQVTFYGGKNGLLVNNTDICAHPYRASVLLEGHNGSTADQRPLILNSCHAPDRHKPKRHRHR